jgi:hypothetical protein
MIPNQSGKLSVTRFLAQAGFKAAAILNPLLPKRVIDAGG